MVWTYLTYLTYLTHLTLRPRPPLGLALGPLPFRPGERFVPGFKCARDDRLAVVRDVDLDAVGHESRKAGDSAAFSAQRPQRGRLIVHTKKRTTMKPQYAGS